MVDPKEVNPSGVYSFAEAVRLIPSSQMGKNLHLATLHRWRIQGKVKAHQAPGRGWFIYGSEILRLLAYDQQPEIKIQSPAQRKRDHEATMAELKRLGV